MYATDFEYDGQYLSDYGFIICDFDYSKGSVTVDTGSKLSFEKVSRNGGKLFSLASATYDECISTEFDICKNPDIYDYEEREISNDEYRDIVRWLNRKEFLKFQVIDDGNTDRDTCYYNVSFNIQKIKIGGKLYGLHLTTESDKPFGYGQEQCFSWNFTQNSNAKILSDVSDEIGFIYPDMTIICNADGDLSIHNELLDCTMLIKKCTKGEIITIRGNEHIIMSDNIKHDICNNFNYEFLKIGNTFNNRNNRITVSSPCKITIKYSPIIKDAP